MPATGRPNIVICMCDQLRAFEVGCYGHPVVRTPNMDRLAAQGCRFVVGCSNSPLCIPARNVLLSGQYARTCIGTNSNFCGFPPCEERIVCEDPTLPETLRNAGYRTALVGKWHIHAAPRLLGFDEAVYPHNLHQHYRQSFYDIDGRRTDVPGFSLDYEMEHVRKFIRKQDDQTPFFLYYNISPPHSPIADAPEHYTRMYSRDQAIIRDNAWVDGKLVHDPVWFRNYMWDYLGHMALHAGTEEIYMPDDYVTRRFIAPSHGVPRMVRDLQMLMKDPTAGPALRKQFPYLDDSTLENFDIRDLTALYYGMVTCVDDRVGELMEVLEETGQADNTIVLFTSDHGDNLGSHHLWMKDRLYEESIRVPMIVRWPRELTSRVVDTQVASFVDLMPTLLGLAEVDPPATCQGTDLSDIVRGRAETVGENCAYIEAYRHQAIGIRTIDHLYGMPMVGPAEPQWKPDDNIAKHLAFHLPDDPYQQNNLADARGSDEPFTALRARLQTWHNNTPRRPVPEPRIKAHSVAVY